LCVHVFVVMVYLCVKGFGWVGLRYSYTYLFVPFLGDVTGFIGQHHVDLHWSNRSEVSEEEVKSKVSAAAGTRSFVLDQTDTSGGRIHLSRGI